MKFRATVELNGKTATGIEVPDEVVAALSQGQRPPVLVRIGGHSYRTTVARMQGRLALAGDEAARTTYERLSFTHRKEWVRWVEEAKKPETRATRIAKTVQSLHDGQRTR